jgi:hypothetical protein
VTRQEQLRLAVATSVGGALSLALAVWLLHRAQARTTNLGPTAATLEEAYAAGLGAGIGLLLAGALGAFLTLSRQRFALGLLAGALAYLVVDVPALVLTRPSDESIADALTGAFAFAFVLLPFAAFGAVLGALLGRLHGWFTTGRSPPARV